MRRLPNRSSAAFKQCSRSELELKSKSVPSKSTFSTDLQQSVSFCATSSGRHKPASSWSVKESRSQARIVSGRGASAGVVSSCRARRLSEKKKLLALQADSAHDLLSRAHLGLCHLIQAVFRRRSSGQQMSKVKFFGQFIFLHGC